MRHVALLLTVVLAVFGRTVSARAGADDYCEAYARDFADTGALEGEEWNRRFVNARDACLLQYTPQSAAPKVDITSPEPEVEAAPEPAAAPKTNTETESAPDPEPVEKPKPRKPEKKKIEQAEKPKPKPAVKVATEKPKTKTKVATKRKPKPSQVTPDAADIDLGGNPSILEEALAEGRPSAATPERNTSNSEKPTLVKSLLKRFNPKVLTRKKDAADKEDTRIVSAGGGGKLRPGSAAWNDYCARKYTSFNPDTGTYLSYNGVERKCLVTRN